MINAKTRLQVERAAECKRYMAAHGKTPVSEIMIDDLLCLDFRALQGSTVFRVTFDSAGRQSTKYL